ncbi:hypothetical protein GCM10029978_008660 [Actinoallomurus acanthiterrae]
MIGCAAPHSFNRGTPSNRRQSQKTKLAGPRVQNFQRLFVPLSGSVSYQNVGISDFNGQVRDDVAPTDPTRQTMTVHTNAIWAFGANTDTGQSSTVRGAQNLAPFSGQTLVFTGNYRLYPTGPIFPGGPDSWSSRPDPATGT